MTLHRFFIPTANIVNHQIVLSRETSRQIEKVLRLKSGNQIMVLDNSGQEYLVQIDQTQRGLVTGIVISRQLNTNEPKLKITLYQALTSKDKLELILQKGTEVGISEFVLVETQRSLLRMKDIKPDRVEQFKKIVTEAAEQSARGKIPMLSAVVKYEDAILQSAGNSPVLIAREGEDQNSLKQVLKKLSGLYEISIFIGPEGGFNQSEIDFAKQHQVIPVSLGSRILRTETAGLVMAAQILFAKE